MNKIPRINSIVIFSLLIILAFSAFKQNNKVTKDEAIKIAEEFIVINGYTTLPADTTQMSFELFDGYLSKSKKEIVNRRFNTLHAKAFCYSENDDSWHIGFLSTSVDINSLDSICRKTDLSGRAVIVNKNGKEVRIAHKDPRFSYFIKL